MYEPETASICYCGHIIVSTGLPLKELVPGLLEVFFPGERTLRFDNRYEPTCKIEFIE